LLDVFAVCGQPVFNAFFILAGDDFLGVLHEKEGCEYE
jgi:hypothetical protein